MDLEDARTRMKFVLHDRDASFTAAFDAVFGAAGVRVIRSAARAPRMNSIMERWIGNCRRELLDRTLIWNQRHLMSGVVSCGGVPGDGEGLAGELEGDGAADRARVDLDGQLATAGDQVKETR